VQRDLVERGRELAADERERGRAPPCDIRDGPGVGEALDDLGEHLAGAEGDRRGLRVDAGRRAEGERVDGGDHGGQRALGARVGDGAIDGVEVRAGQRGVVRLRFDRRPEHRRERRRGRPRRLRLRSASDRRDHCEQPGGAPRRDGDLTGTPSDVVSGRRGRSAIACAPDAIRCAHDRRLLFRRAR
jgi:hypothetical protein